MKPNMPPKKIDILGCALDNLSLEHALEYSQNLIETNQRGHIATVNVSMLMAMRKDRELKDYIQQSALTLADGQPLIWLSSLLGKPLEERVAGIDYSARMFALAEQKNYSVFLLGATSNINRRTRDKLERCHPAINIVGTLDGYFPLKEASEKAGLIAKTGADILVVAMGSPRQEHFIKSQWENLGVKLAIPVGGSFEVWAGHRKRAPRWMQRAP